MNVLNVRNSYKRKNYKIFKNRLIKYIIISCKILKNFLKKQKKSKKINYNYKNLYK